MHYGYAYGLFVWVVTIASYGVAAAVDFTTEGSLVELSEDVTQHELCATLNTSEAVEMTVTTIYQNISAIG